MTGFLIGFVIGVVLYGAHLSGRLYEQHIRARDDRMQRSRLERLSHADPQGLLNTLRDGRLP